MTDTTLVTGFPTLLARRLAARLLETAPTERVVLLARDKFLDDARRFVATLPPDRAARVEVLEGDVVDIDLGLPGAEYQALRSRLTAIHHTATVSFVGAKRKEAEQVNIEGTRGMLELAAECSRLRRFTHWSSALVSGTRSGVILEEELDRGQRFRNLFEETKFRGERLVREAARRLPITVVRPGVVVGDSRTGAIDRFDGPYYLMLLIVAAPLDVSLPLPGRGDAPLNLVPMDFVVDAAVALSRDPAAEGGTFHLTDPCPLAARAVYELVAEHAGRKAPRGSIPTGWARAILRTPLLEPLARAPLSLVDAFHHLAVYNCKNTSERLAGTSIRCPPFDAYAGAIVRYVKEMHDARGRQPGLGIGTPDQADDAGEGPDVLDPFDRVAGTAAES